VAQKRGWRLFIALDSLGHTPASMGGARARARAPPSCAHAWRTGRAVRCVTRRPASAALQPGRTDGDGAEGAAHLCLATLLSPQEQISWWSSSMCVCTLRHLLQRALRAVVQREAGDKRLARGGRQRERLPRLVLQLELVLRVRPQAPAARVRAHW
jgi:hypothetical protein